MKKFIRILVFMPVLLCTFWGNFLAAESDRQLSVLVFEKSLTWEEAREACRAAGGDLASLDSEELFNYARTELLYEALAAHADLKGLWIGGVRPSEPGAEWLWLNGKPLPKFVHGYWIRNGMGEWPGLNVFLLAGNSSGGLLCANGAFLQGEDKLAAAVMEK